MLNQANAALNPCQNPGAPDSAVEPTLVGPLLPNLIRTREQVVNWSQDTSMRKGTSAIKNGTVAAIDIGSSKICCFIARVDGKRPPHVIGIGHQASRGFKGGNVVDIDALEDAITDAVHTAEQMAGETVDKVIVNISGGQPTSHRLNLEIAIAGHAVTDRDLRQALDHANQIKGLDGAPEAGREIIHSLFTGYTLDGNKGILDPRGMHGERLGLNIHIITVATNARRNLVSCINRCQLEVHSLAVSGYASGLSSLVDDEMELGATLVDMGGTTTSIAVFEEGHLIHNSVIPVGGRHVTSDIARGLSTPIIEAERMKTLYGHAIASEADSQNFIDVSQMGEEGEKNSQQVSHSLLVGIIQPRIEETLELVADRLHNGGLGKAARRRLVLTGGGCQLPGMTDLAQHILGAPARVGRPLHFTGLVDATRRPNFSTCAGLLTYATLEKEELPPEKPRGVTQPDSFFGKMGCWVKENF